MLETLPLVVDVLDTFPLVLVLEALQDVMEVVLDGLETLALVVLDVLDTLPLVLVEVELVLPPVVVVVLEAEPQEVHEH